MSFSAKNYFSSSIDNQKLKGCPYFKKEIDDGDGSWWNI